MDSPRLVDLSKSKIYPLEFDANKSCSILGYLWTSLIKLAFWMDGRIKDGNLEASFSKVIIFYLDHLDFSGICSFLGGIKDVSKVLASVSSWSQKLGVDISIVNFEL